MAAINFPNVPSNGQTYEFGDYIYTFDGVKWTSILRYGSSAVKIQSTTAPGAPEAGLQWFDDISGRNYFWHINENTSQGQWVEEAPQGVVDGPGEAFDLTLTYTFATVADFKVSLIAFPDGKVIHLKDRGVDFTKISGVGTANTFNVIASDVVDQSIELDESKLLYVSTAHYGAVSGDITSLLTEFAASTHTNKVISGGSYIVIADINFDQGEDSITFEGSPTFTIDGTYSEGVFIFGSTDRTLIFTTVSTLAQGDSLLPVLGLSKDDLISVWNPIDGSYLGSRPTYRQSEFVVVSADSPLSGNTEIIGSLIDTYPAGTELYLFDTVSAPKKVTGEVKFISSSYGVRLPLIISQALGLDITGLKVNQLESTHTLQLLGCYNVSGIGVEARQTASTTSGLDYGLVVTNCQHVDLEGWFHAERHGSTTGGDAKVGAVINRFVNVRGKISTTGLGLVAGAEWHGNTESSSYAGHLTGLIVAGHNNRVLRGSRIDGVPSADSPTVLGSELKSMEHDLSNIHIYGDVALTSAKGVVDLGGISDALTIDTDIDGRFKLNGSLISSPLNSVGIRLRNRGSNSVHELDVRGTTIKCPSATVGSISVQKVSGSTLQRVYMAGFSDDDSNPISLDNDVLVSGLSDTDIEVMPVTDTGAFYVLKAVTFNKVFPFPPSIRTQYEGGHIGSLLPVATAENVTSSGFNMVLQNVDNTITFSSAVVKDIMWEASINT